VLQDVAVTGGVSLAGCQRLLNPEGSESEDATPTVEPTETPFPYERELLEEAQRIDDEMPDILVPGTGITDHAEEFLKNKDIPEKFRRNQIENFLDLPTAEEISKQERFGEVPEPEGVIPPRRYVLVLNSLHKDDWTATGLPHIFPDGSDGPGHHYLISEEEEYEILDGFVLQWYDHKGTVYDVPESGIEQQDWKYLGFTPEEGDRVGKLGESHDLPGMESSGRGSVANYLGEDVNPEDLTGQPVAVLYHDWEGPTAKNPHPAKLSKGALEIMKDVFADEGIDFYPVEGNEVDLKELESRVDGDAYTAAVSSESYKQNMPEPLKGTAEYCLARHEIESGAAGVAPFTVVHFENNEVLASLPMHENYGHPFIAVEHAPRECPTVMTPAVHVSEEEDVHNDFLEGEWKVLKDQLKYTSENRTRAAYDDPTFRTHSGGYYGIFPLEQYSDAPERDAEYSSGEIETDC